MDLPNYITDDKTCNNDGLGAEICLSMILRYLTNVVKVSFSFINMQITCRYFACKIIG